MSETSCCVSLRPMESDCEAVSEREQCRIHALTCELANAAAACAALFDAPSGNQLFTNTQRINL